MSAFDVFVASPSVATFTRLPDAVQIVLTIAASAVFHALVFISAPGHWFVDDKSKKDEAAVMRSYVASAVHAIAVCTMVAMWLAEFGLTATLNESPQAIMGADSLPGFARMKLVISFALGYFAYDTLAMLFNSSFSNSSTFVHHALMAVGFGAGLVWQVAQPYHFIYLLEEASTPFLNLKAMTKHWPRLNLLVSTLFMLTFLFSRIVCGSYLFYHGVRSGIAYIQTASTFQSALCLFQLSACAATRALNLFWARLILIKTYQTCCVSKKRSSSSKSE